jgi:hypothetical protein
MSGRKQRVVTQIFGDTSIVRLLSASLRFNYIEESILPNKIP